MTVFRPAYRMIIYAPRSIDATEATVLVPAAGAPHSDPFQVTTLGNLAGYKPYMLWPQGRTGKIDVLTRTTDVGAMLVELIDKKLSDNLTRWVTSYFGNIKGEYQAGGLKSVIQESLDLGATWIDWFTGRLQTVSLSKKPSYQLQLQEESSEFNQDIFTGRPHTSITYAGFLSLCPIGPTIPFGPMPAIKPFTAVQTGQAIFGGVSVGIAVNITLDAASQARPEMLVTSNLLSATSPTAVNGPTVAGGAIGSFGTLPSFNGVARARLTHTSGANNGLTGDYIVGFIGGGAPDASGHSKLVAFSIAAVPSTDPLFLALPAAGVTVSGYIYSNSPANPNNPLLIDLPGGPVQLIQDILNGKFGHIWAPPEVLPPGKSYGDPKRTYQVNSSNFSPFLADTTYPPVRFIITGQQLSSGTSGGGAFSSTPSAIQMGTFIQEFLLKPYALAMFMDGSGKVNLVDLRLPSTLAGIGTLSDSDLIDATDDLNWNFDRNQAMSRVDALRWTDQPFDPSTLKKDPSTWPGLWGGISGVSLVGNQGTDIFQSLSSLMILLTIGSGDFGDKTYTLDAQGYRSMGGEMVGNQSRAAYLEAKLLEYMNTIRRPWSVGASTVRLKCRRTSNVPLIPGKFLLPTLSALPDPSTNKRGGTRLILVTSVSKSGLSIDLLCLDMGIGVIAASPSATQPVQATGNTSIGVSTTVTLNASSQPVDIRYAVTATSVGTAPLDTDPLWTVAMTNVSTGGVKTFYPTTPGQRIWVELRTHPTQDTAPQMPSPWVLAGGTGRVDLVAWPVPSALAKSLDVGKSFRLSWTNGATDLMILVAIRSPTSDPPTFVDTLPPGSTFFDFIGVDPTTTYRVGIRYWDGRNFGPEVTLDVTTAASSNTWPAMSGASVLV